MSLGRTLNATQWARYDAALADAGGRACRNCKHYRDADGRHEESYCVRVEFAYRGTSRWDYWFAQNAKYGVIALADSCGDAAIYWEPRDVP